MWAPGVRLARRFEGEQLLVGDWRCDAPQPGRPTPERPRYAQLELQRAGSNTRQTAAGVLVADPAAVLWHCAALAFDLTHPSATPQTSTMLFFAPALADELFGDAPATGSAPLSSALALAHHRLRRALAGPAVDPLEAEELALTLARGALAGASPRRGRPHPLARAVRDARHLLASRHAERLTLSALAAEVGVSPFQLARAFRRETGASVHAYLTRLRLRVALGALDRHVGDLTALALRSGFASHSHFTRVFHSEFGAPPSRLAAPAAAPRSAGRAGDQPSHGWTSCAPGQAWVKRT